MSLKQISTPYSHSCEKGSVASYLVMLLFIVGVFTILVFYVFGQIVRSNQFGLRQNYFSIPGLLEKGFEDQGLLPGLHWKVPFLSTVHTLQRDFQFIHFNNKVQNGDLDRAELEIPTTDGSKVFNDITLAVRYFEQPEEVPTTETEKKAKEVASALDVEAEAKEVPVVTYHKRAHGGPVDLVNTYTIKRLRQLELLTTQTEDFLKSSLSTLSTTDYYNPVLRETAALRATEDINDVVAPLGIELWGTLIRRYIYSEKNIDDQIFAKNLQEQTERLNAAKRKLEQARAETKDAVAIWDAKIKDLKVTAEQEKVVIVSEADRYEVEQRSKGDRAVQEAIAKVDKLKNTVLAQTPGADVYVARQMAPLLKTLGGGVVTDIDPFNVDDWVKKLIK